MENKKKEKTKIDIILPNYNSSKFIIKTIQSVLKQTYKNWKLIIVDDFSDAETKNILKKISKNKNIKVFFLNKNHGAGFCRNFAIQKSNSHYLAFIDSDDIWEKNKLKKQISFMKNNNYLFSYTDYKTFGEKKRKVNNPSKLNYIGFLKNTSIATSTMMIKRDIIGNIKFTNTKICEDFFFKCKLLKKIGYAHCLKQYLTNYRIRKNSLQSSNLRNFYWIWKINKNYNKLNIIDNFISLLFISINSLKKYGGKNIFKF
jgi:teichuronic acid biosynthesis glycosyltransferase TuaG